MLWILVVSIVLTQLATLSGWWTAEFGRQPWIVWQLLRTDDAESPQRVHRPGGVLASGCSWSSTSWCSVVFLSPPQPQDQGGATEPPDQEDDHTGSLPDSFGEIFRRRSRVSSRG